MLNLGIILILQIFCILNLAEATNYCDPALCTTNEQTRPHIGCNHNGKFASRCIQPSMVIMTPRLKEFILYNHNDLRNKVANGSLPGFQSARRMPTLTWDSEIEFLAGLNVRKCEMEHDECHNTEAYKYSGQNIGYDSNTEPIVPSQYEDSILYLITAWFDEYLFANQRDTDKCVRSNRALKIGHFTEMIHEKSSKVGCNIAKYTTYVEEENYSTLLLTCNYNFGNLVEFPIYVRGPMGSGCQTGTNPEFNGLCSVSENVPPVPFEEQAPISLPPNLSRYLQAVPSGSAAQSGPAIQQVPPQRFLGTGPSAVPELSRNRPLNIPVPRSAAQVRTVPSARNFIPAQPIRHIPTSNEAPPVPSSGPPARTAPIARNFEPVQSTRFIPAPNEAPPLPSSGPPARTVPSARNFVPVQTTRHMPMSNEPPPLPPNAPPARTVPSARNFQTVQTTRYIPVSNVPPNLPSSGPPARTIPSARNFQTVQTARNIPVSNEPPPLPPSAPPARTVPSARNFQTVQATRYIPVSNEAPPLPSSIPPARRVPSARNFEPDESARFLPEPPRVYQQVVRTVPSGRVIAPSLSTSNIPESDETCQLDDRVGERFVQRNLPYNNDRIPIVTFDVPHSRRSRVQWPFVKFTRF